MSTRIDDLIKTQQDTNRLLKLLIRATLTNPPSPMVRKPNLRVVRDSDFTAAQLAIPVGGSLTVMDLPEKPDTDVDVGFLAATSNINSQKVRHTFQVSGVIGKSRPFNFNATQQELAGAGFTSPNSFPLWTPAGAGAAGIFTVVTNALAGLTGFHQRVQIILKNEDVAVATIQTNGLFITAYEFDQATKNIFARVLADTDPEALGTLKEAALRLSEIEP